MVDVWVRIARPSAEKLSEIVSDLRAALAELDEDAHGFRQSYLHDSVTRLFVDVELPMRIAEPIDQTIQRARLHRECSSLQDDYWSSSRENLRFTNRRLSWHANDLSGRGGRQPATMFDATVAYLQSMERRQDTLLVRGQAPLFHWSQRLVPIAMVGLLVASWRISLSASSLVLWMCVFVILLGFVFFPFTAYLQWPPRKIFLSGRTTSAILFSVIASFGTAYGFLALLPGNMLGKLPSTTIGSAYLIATGIAFTQGLLNGTGPLSGPALVVAHIEMLLFASAVVASVVTVLQLRYTSPDEPEYDGRRSWRWGGRS